MRIAICDDNKLEIELFRERVEGFLKRKGDYRFQITEYSKGNPLIYDVEEGMWFDVIVLDMILENENGLEVAHRLRDVGYNGNIIFWTADEKHFREAFDVGAVQYAIKGKEYGRMYAAIDEILSHLRDKVLTVKCRGELFRIEYGDIEYIESRAKACHIFTIGNHCYVTTCKLNDLEEELCDKRFLRCHQSFLVNMDHIQSVNDNFIMDSGDIVQIRRRNHNEIKEIYENYIN